MSYERLLNADCSTLTANAQVGEWLKPADCKSAPPRRYEGSNPSLCTRFSRGTAGSFVEKKLVLALAAYVGLAALAFATLPDQRVRGATLAILALFAVKTWVRRKDVMHPGEEGSNH
jgi:hypothetical protein